MRKQDIKELYEHLRSAKVPEMAKNVGDFMLYESLFAGYVSRIANGEEFVDISKIPEPDQGTLNDINELRQKAELSEEEKNFVNYFVLMEEINNKLKEEVLFQFFAGNFHQDFLYDHENPDAVIAEYKSENTPQGRALLSKAILEYVSRFPDDTELEDKLLRELGCYYATESDGMTARAWMQKVAHQLISD